MRELNQIVFGIYCSINAYMLYSEGDKYDVAVFISYPAHSPLGHTEKSVGGDSKSHQNSLQLSVLARNPGHNAFDDGLSSSG